MGLLGKRVSGWAVGQGGFLMKGVVLATGAVLVLVGVTIKGVVAMAI